MSENSFPPSYRPTLRIETEMIDKLDKSRKHAKEGMVMDADVAISKLKVKYG